MTAQQQGVITTSPDDTRRPRRTRTTILAVMCLVILVAWGWCINLGLRCRCS